MSENKRRYRAFISYSQRDKRWAVKLHKALEAWRTPGGVTAPGLDPKSRRLGRFFRDDEEMGAVESLGAALQGSIDDSESLIVLCSPQSARSKWVDLEVRRFKHRGVGRVFAVIVGGKPNSNDPKTECFCPALKEKVGPDGELTGEQDEPLAPDWRKDGLSRLKVRLAAGLVGAAFDDLWKRERRRARARRMQALAVGVVLFGVVGAGLGWIERERSPTTSAGLAQSARQAFERAIDEGHTVETTERAVRLAALGARRDLLARPAPAALQSLIDAATQLPDGIGIGEGEEHSFVAQSVDGRRIATKVGRFSGGKRSVRVWDAETGALVGAPISCGDKLNAAQFSPDGAFLFLDCYAPRLFSIETGESVADPPIAFSEMRGHLSPNGRLFVLDGRLTTTNSASERVIDEGEAYGVFVVDAFTGTPLAGPLNYPPEHRSRFSFARFSPDGERLLTVNKDGEAQVWRTDTYQPVTPIFGNATSPKSPGFSPDGRSVVLFGYKTVNFWDATTGEAGALRFEAEDREFLEAAAFSADGRRFAVVTSWFDERKRGDSYLRHRRYRLFDVETGEWIGDPFDIDGGPYAARLTGDRFERVPGVAGLDVLFWPDASDDYPDLGVAFSPSIPRILSKPGPIIPNPGYSFRIVTGFTAPWMEDISPPNSLVDFFLSPDHTVLWVGDALKLDSDRAPETQTWRRRDLSTYEPDVDSEPIPAQVETPDGLRRERIAGISPDGRRLIGVRSTRPPPTSAPDAPYVHPPAYLILRDARTGAVIPSELEREPGLEFYTAFDSAFSADGWRLVTLSRPIGESSVPSRSNPDPQYLLRVWDVATGASVGSGIMIPVRRGFHSFSLSRTGEELIVEQGDGDRTFVDVYDVATGESVRNFELDSWQVTLHGAAEALVTNESGSVVFREALTGEIFAELPPLWESERIELTDDRRFVVRSHLDRGDSFGREDDRAYLQIWDVATARPLGPVTQSHREAQHGQILADGARIALRTATGFLLYDVASGDSLVGPFAQESPVSAFRRVDGAVWNPVRPISIRPDGASAIGLVNYQLVRLDIGWLRTDAQRAVAGLPPIEVRRRQHTLVSLVCDPATGKLRGARRLLNEGDLKAVPALQGEGYRIGDDVCAPPGAIARALRVVDHYWLNRGATASSNNAD